MILLKGWGELSPLLLPAALVQPNSSSPVAQGLQGNPTLWSCYICPITTASDMLLTGEIKSRYPKGKDGRAVERQRADYKNGNLLILCNPAPAW